MTAIRALTVLQPWAWCIAHAGKSVENRSWNTNYRGPVLLHAGRRYDATGARSAAALAGRSLPASRGPWTVRGAVIACCELVDVHTCDGSCSPWAIPGAWHLVLADIYPTEPIPMRGALGLWRPRTTLAPTEA